MLLLAGESAAGDLAVAVEFPDTLDAAVPLFAKDPDD